jgi:hypothetical protein
LQSKQNEGESEFSSKRMRAEVSDSVSTFRAVEHFDQSAALRTSSAHAPRKIAPACGR